MSLNLSFIFTNTQNMHKIYILLTNFLTFNLEAAVCNHGFFMMAPNVWDCTTKSLSRPLRLSDSTRSVHVTISQPSGCRLLLVEVHDVNKLYRRHDEDVIKAQVSRMMRLTDEDEKDVQQFQQLHPKAKALKFGRIFRAPCLFEDAVKSVLLCYSKWEKSLRMAESLCNFKSAGNFPSAQELAYVNRRTLKGLKLGHRAEQIRAFARGVITGEVNLKELETCKSATKLHNELTKVDGFGDFVAYTISMCMGFYRHVPIDTETARHLKEVHNIETETEVKRKKAVASVYDKYEPFQCIAFWFEISRWYSNKYGKLSELPSSSYSMITGS